MPTRHTITLGASALAAALAAPAHAQITLPWFTVDGGGGVSTGAGITLSATAGQCDAGAAQGGITLSGGFWSVAPPTCYANCDGSTATPILNVADFTCFLQKFTAGCP